MTDNEMADADERAQLQDEIERLRGIVEFVEAASRQQREGLQAEVERLRKHCDDMAAQRDDLKAALREIAVADTSLGWSIARAALEETPTADR